MSRSPDFRQLVDDELDPGEERRLRRVHELLVDAGPPPELPPSLEAPPRAPKARVFPLRRRATVLGLAAALALATLGGGYLAGKNRSDFEVVKAGVPMRGTSAAPGARASLDLGRPDESGNWPMLIHVRGLKPLGRGGYYELALTRGKRSVASCGTFRVHDGTTTVQLNAPYRLTDFDGWVVTTHSPGEESGRVLLTT